MNKRFIFVFIFLLTFVANISYSQDIATVINQINEFFKQNKTLKGNFELIEGRSKSKGYFIFKNPHYFKMVFGSKKRNEEFQKRIISDGKTLWVYLPRLGIVVDQDLNELSPIGISTPALGIRRIIQHYDYRFDENNSKLRKVKGLDHEVYIIELTAKSSKYGFKKIYFYVREDGFITKSVAINDSKKKFILIRKDVELNPEVDENEFRREVPKNARVIKNPFVSNHGF